jgi:hypothetical protein
MPNIYEKIYMFDYDDHEAATEPFYWFVFAHDTDLGV